MELVFFFGALIGGDVDRLGADGYERREVAQTRLRSYGLLAVPQLLRAYRGSESPEVRHRAWELLAPYRRIDAKLNAIAVLTGPHLPDAAAFFADVRLRQDVFKLAINAGCPNYDDPLYLWQFPPSWEHSADDAIELLREYREQLGLTCGSWKSFAEGIGASVGAKP